MEQAGKNTILLVRGTAAEPVGLSAFAAAQPDVQLQTVSGLDEARAALRLWQQEVLGELTEGQEAMLLELLGGMLDKSAALLPR